MTHANGSSARVEPVTDRDHDNSWSANLEQPRHGEDSDLVIAQAVDAIEHTTSGNHVNLVTHGNHGHPSEYLYPALSDEFDGDGEVDDVDSEVEWEYVDRCGCGGYVTRVYVK